MKELLKLEPETWVYTDTLDHDFINEYHLTLNKYTVFQLLAIINTENKDQDITDYLNKHAHHFEENMDFRNGVNDAFCEIVKAGVKKLALSHATDDEDVFSKEFHSAYQCVNKYGISMYVEEDLIETLLFDISGCKVIIFYLDKQDIEDYKTLKYNIRNNKEPSIEDKIAYAKELGRLLSYSPKRIDEMIKNNMK